MASTASGGSGLPRTPRTRFCFVARVTGPSMISGMADSDLSQSMLRIGFFASISPRRNDSAKCATEQLSYGVCTLTNLTFPHYDDDPPSTAKSCFHPGITPHICLELLNPERPIALRRSRSSTGRVAVPEAAVHEDNPTTRTVRYVWRTEQIMIVYTETMPQRVKKLAYF